MIGVRILKDLLFLRGLVTRSEELSWVHTKADEELETLLLVSRRVITPQTRFGAERQRHTSHTPRHFATA